MPLPIIQLDRYERKGFAGQISDASLLDVLTGVATVAVPVGTVVDITSTAGDDLKFELLADAAAGKAAKRPAIVARSQYDVTNTIAKGAPVNLVESGRVWVLSSGTVTAQSPVQLSSNGKTVTNATSNAIRGLVFTGRVDTDQNGKAIAEVQIRPQTA